MGLLRVLNVTAEGHPLDGTVSCLAGAVGVFDGANLVSCAGLAPVLALGQRGGLPELVATSLTLKAPGGVNARLKVTALIAGMVAGADSIKTWICCGTAALAGCSPGCERPRRWVQCWFRATSVENSVSPALEPGT